MTQDETKEEALKADDSELEVESPTTEETEVEETEVSPEESDGEEADESLSGGR